MKEVLFFTPAFCGPGRVEKTGGLISNLHFMRAIRSRCNVTILTFDNQLEAGEYDFDGFRYIVKNPPRYPNRIKQGRALRVLARSMLADYYKQSSYPDLAFFTAASVPYLLHDRQASFPRVIISRAFEDFGWNCRYAPVRERFRSAFELFRRAKGTKAAYTYADGVVTNSKFMQQAIMTHFGINRVNVLYPCIGSDYKALGNAPVSGEKSIGFVNRNSGKNVKFILALAKSLPDFQFLIYGAKIKSSTLIPENVTQCGWESEPEKLYTKANLWLVPSSWSEPFGRVAAEAICAGRRVLVSNLGGLPEAVSHKKALIVESMNLEEWAERIKVAVSTEAPVYPIDKRYSETTHDSKVLELLDRWLRNR